MHVLRFLLQILGMNRFWNTIVAIVVVATLLAGCGNSSSEDEYGFDELESLWDEDEETLSDTVDVWERYYTMSLDSVLAILSSNRYVPNCDYGLESPIEEYGCYIRMNALCDNEKLHSLTKTHPAPAVRALAFDILHDRRYEGCYQLVKDCLNDTSLIEWGSCSIWTESVASFMVDRMRIVNDGGHYTHLRMTPEQQREVDSILIFTPNMGHIDHLKWVLEKLPPDPKFYSRIRSMYLYEGVPSSLPTLARFRNEQDFKLVEEALEHYADDDDGYELAEIGLNAVANWPDKRFWPMLRKIRWFVVQNYHHDCVYFGLQQGCINAAYHYYSPRAARYIRTFNDLTFGGMMVGWEFCRHYRHDLDNHPEIITQKVPRSYKRMFRRYDN